MSSITEDLYASEEDQEQDDQEEQQEATTKVGGLRSPSRVDKDKSPIAFSTHANVAEFSFSYPTPPTAEFKPLSFQVPEFAPKLSTLPSFTAPPAPPLFSFQRDGQYKHAESLKLEPSGNGNACNGNDCNGNVNSANDNSGNGTSGNNATHGNSSKVNVEGIVPRAKSTRARPRKRVTSQTPTSPKVKMDTSTSTSTSIKGNSPTANSDQGIGTSVWTRFQMMSAEVPFVQCLVEQNYKRAMEAAEQEGFGEAEDTRATHILELKDQIQWKRNHVLENIERATRCLIKAKITTTELLLLEPSNHKTYSSRSLTKREMGKVSTFWCVSLMLFCGMCFWWKHFGNSFLNILPSP